MQQVVLNEKESLNFMREQILLLKKDPVVVSNAKYHHSTIYKKASSILQHGILPLKDAKEKGLICLSEEQLHRYSDTLSHINGIDRVSLAVLGLNDLYKDEMEYDPRLFFDNVDFLVSNEVSPHVYRSTEHYGNEYLHRGAIGVNNLISMDIRLLKLIDVVASNLSKNHSDVLQPQTTQDVIQRYHTLREIAIQLQQMESHILLREQSAEDDTLLDMDQTAKLPQIILK